MLLGALCATLPAELLDMQPAQLLQLFEPALGTDAATELDRRYCSNVVGAGHVVMIWVCSLLRGHAGEGRGWCWAKSRDRPLDVVMPCSCPTGAQLVPAVPAVQSSLDHVVAMELWWRCAALQAVPACITRPLAAAPRAQQPALLRRAAALLKPTLDVLTAHAALQVRQQGRAQPARMLPLCMLLAPT